LWAKADLATMRTCLINNIKQKSWKDGSRERVLAHQAPSPEFICGTAKAIIHLKNYFSKFTRNKNIFRRQC
jgi:hypothetical protein